MNINSISAYPENPPLFQFTTVADCPHIYVPYECELLWTQFFSKLRLASDGKRYFNGVEITRGSTSNE